MELCLISTGLQFRSFILRYAFSSTLSCDKLILHREYDLLVTFLFLFQRKEMVDMRTLQIIDTIALLHYVQYLVKF